MLNEFLAALFGGTFNPRFYLGLVFAIMAVTLPLPYLLLHVQESRNPKPDHQVGIKAVLHYAFSLAVFLLLMGLSAIVIDLLTQKYVVGRREDTWFTHHQRDGAALAFAGLLFLLLNWLMLQKGTDEAQRPAARRAFTGWRLAIHSLVVMLAATVTLVVLFEDEPNRHDWIMMLGCFGVLIVWGPSWLLHLGLLWWYGAQADAVKPAVSWDTDAD